MISVKDYLDLKDYEFILAKDEGVCNSFKWIRCSQYKHINLFRIISPPKTVCSLIPLYFDGSETAVLYAGNEDFSALGEFAISQIAGKWPEVHIQADPSFLLLNGKTVDLDKLSRFLEQLTKAGCFATNEEPSHSLWQSFFDLSPIMYHSIDNDGFLLISNNKEMYQSFLASKEVQDVEQYYRSVIRNLRIEQWKSLGPEVGPEECEVGNCNRRRVRRSSNCFMHEIQMKCFPFA